MTQFDLIVIGGGPGGYVAAIKAAKAGLAVALIENRRVGGTCLNRGCIPAKAMIHASSLYREALEGARFGVHTEEASYDYDEILAYKQECIDSLVSGVESLLAGNGVQVFQGTGRLDLPEDGKNVVTVIPGAGGESAEQRLTADYVILATGSKPAQIPVAGMDLPHVVNSDGLFALDHVPQSLLIIGGGVIGVEFATVFSNLGCEVTIVEALPKLLDNFDREISQNLKMILKKRGVEAHLNAFVKECLPADDDWVVCCFEEKGKPQEISAEYVLVAAGRTPVMEGLFGDGVLEETVPEKGAQDEGVTGDGAPEGSLPEGSIPEDGRIRKNGRYIAVDGSFRTGLPGVYAIGDLTGGIQLAHAASAHGARAVEVILAEKQGNGEPAFAQEIDVIPAGVYTDPEIATVGLTEAQAKEQGREVITGKFIMSANGKSLITKDERGFIKVVADASTEEILGAQMMCSRATDMIAEFADAIANHMTAADMLRCVRPHPTYNEGIAEALEDLHGASVHTMPRRRR